MLWERCWDLQKTEHKATRHNQWHLKALSEALSARRQRGIATEPTQTTGETRREAEGIWEHVERKNEGYRERGRMTEKRNMSEREERRALGSSSRQCEGDWEVGSLQSCDISMLPSRLFTATYVKSSIHLSQGVRLSGAQDITSAQHAGGVYGSHWLRWDRNHLALYHRAVKSLKVLLDNPEIHSHWPCSE